MNLEVKREIHDEICGVLNVLYANKNRRYNDSFSKTFKEYGPTALLIRIDDKFGRLKELIRNPDIDPLDESVKDTLMDLANYAIMGLMELDAMECPAPELEPLNTEDDSDEDEEDTEEDITEPQEESNLKEELEEYTKVELHKIAEALDITVGKKSSKEDLVEAILTKPQADVVEILDELFSGDDESEGEA